MLSPASDRPATGLPQTPQTASIDFTPPLLFRWYAQEQAESHFPNDLEKYKKHF